MKSFVSKYQKRGEREHARDEKEGKGKEKPFCEFMILDEYDLHAINVCMLRDS